MPGGRPSTYSQETAVKICGAISKAIPLAKICEQDGMPEPSTVYLWLSKHPEFSDMYARAREDQADYLAQQIVEIADSSDLDPNDKKVRVDARKWVASKLKPRSYGDRLDLGNADSKPFEVVIK